MSPFTEIQITNLTVTGLGALVVWRYYRDKTCAPEERYSTFGPRFWTGLVDSSVLWPVTFLSGFLITLGLPAPVTAALVVVETLAWLVYTVVMHARYGQTVGKMATKVRVVDFKTEGPLSWKQAWLREGIPTVFSLGILGYQVFAILTGRITPQALELGDASGVSPGWILTAMPGLWFVAEVVTMLMNEKYRALHDLIAGTVVIRTNIPENVTARRVQPSTDQSVVPSPSQG